MEKDVMLSKLELHQLIGLIVVKEPRHLLLPPFNGLISRTNDVGCPSDTAMKLSAAFMIS